MKNRIDNKYVCWALTALSVIGISILFAFLLFRIDEIVAGIGIIFKDVYSTYIWYCNCIFIKSFV